MKGQEVKSLLTLIKKQIILIAMEIFGLEQHSRVLNFIIRHKQHLTRTNTGIAILMD